MATYLQYRCTDAEIEIRGGWTAASGSSSKSYKESNVALTIPALNAINGWADIRSNKLPPRLECFESETMVALERFMQELYVIGVVAFLPNGHLRPLLRACTASLLMYLEDFKAQFNIRN